RPPNGPVPHTSLAPPRWAVVAFGGSGRISMSKETTEPGLLTHLLAFAAFVLSSWFSTWSPEEAARWDQARTVAAAKGVLGPVLAVCAAAVVLGILYVFARSDRSGQGRGAVALCASLRDVRRRGCGGVLVAAAPRYGRDGVGPRVRGGGPAGHPDLAERQ